MLLPKKTKALLKDLEEVRNQMEDLLEDQTVANLPRAYNRVKDSFDNVLQKIEDGDYETTDEERDSETTKVNTDDK
jgi:hypothetical protein